MELEYECDGRNLHEVGPFLDRTFSKPVMDILHTLDGDNLGTKDDGCVFCQGTEIELGPHHTENDE
jgi:hypothetical protein